MEEEERQRRREIRKHRQLPEIVMETLVEKATKMVLVVRTDLGMGQGKVAAQCCHATLQCYKTAVREEPGLLESWERNGQAKLVLRGDGGEAGLVALSWAGRRAGLVVAEVRDAGRTQVEAGSLTVVGIGPGPSLVVDTITKGLKLY